MTSVKKLIEQKKDRLNHLVQSGRIKADYANRSLKEYSQFVSRYYGCGMQLFNNITAGNMLILVAAVLVALS